jgi:hypothetical protein
MIYRRPNMRKLQKSLFIAGIIFFTVFTLPLSADTKMVRGSLIRVGPHGPYPAVNVRLTLFSPSMKQRSAPAYSDHDGRYSFYNIPPGSFLLEIWGHDKNPITQQPVTVLNQSYTDIPQIRVP